MRRLIQRLASVLQLTRVTGAFAAIANVWFVIVWTRAFPEEPGTVSLTTTPVWIALTGGAITALGLYAFGATLNDVVDAKRDRTLRPNRPLAAERVSIEAAMALTVGTLLFAVLGSFMLGLEASILTCIVAIAVTAYNLLGRFVPAIGLPLLSVVYAGHMLVPNVELVFTWPVILVLTHALVIGLISHVLDARVPKLSPRAVAFAVAGWAACCAMLLALGPARHEAGSLWPAFAPLESLWWIAAAVAALAFMSIRRIARLGGGARAAEKVRRYGTLWPAIYACAWMIGAGQAEHAWPLFALAAAGVLGMTILREAYALVDEPIEFRW
ncbi:MAG: UbiA family prenyltransferase [Phycisphaerales bacterium]